MAGEELGAVETEGLHADEDLAGGRVRDGKVFELEDFGAARGVDYGGFHCGHVPGSDELLCFGMCVNHRFSEARG